MEPFGNLAKTHIDISDILSLDMSQISFNLLKRAFLLGHWQKSNVLEEKVTYVFRDFGFLNNLSSPLHFSPFVIFLLHFLAFFPLASSSKMS